ncbi:MAG: LysM peptidoglycan-binding domain-containing protein [Flavobacteriaceae bacterium]
MKKLIVVLIIILYSGLSVAQTSYVSHRVSQGETVFSITQKYQITEEDLFRLNPEVKNGLKQNTVLIIPKTLETVENPSNGDVTFKTHKVKRKETIFGIASIYGTTVEEIKKYNRHLYSNELKKGEQIRIPIKQVTIVSPIDPVEIPPGKHKVAPQETKFGIAKQYGITEAKLEAMNPSIYGSDILAEGIILNVPEKPSVEEPIIEDENYTFYTVQAKEGFYRLKVLFGLTEEEIVALNPHTKEGLKEGMIIKIPKTTTDVTTDSPVSSSKKISIEYNLKNFKPKNVVVFLPFQLNKIQKDSLSLNQSELTNNTTMRLAVDFYAGVLMASEFAKQKGISINLHVFDTQEMEKGVKELFRRKNITNVDLVIGPLRQAFVERTASELSSQNIPVLSPLSNRQGKIYPNFIQSIPQNDVLENKLINYIKENAQGKNLILISDNTSSAKRQKLQSAFPGIKLVSPREGNFFRGTDISSNISEDKENWVLLESTNATVVSSAIGVLNSIRRSQQVRLFTLDRNEAFDFREVSNLHLANLEFTFPSWNKSYNYKENIKFVEAYKEQYSVLPNRFASRGFDIAYDALLRLAYAENIYEANDAIEGETVYVENKFNYQKAPSGGYVNNAVYILKYNQDLNLVELE